MTACREVVIWKPRYQEKIYSLRVGFWIPGFQIKKEFPLNCVPERLPFFLLPNSYFLILTLFDAS